MASSIAQPRLQPTLKPGWTLLALVAGIAVGMAGARGGWGAALGAIEPLGGIWLDALRMTIIPLVVALLVTGIAQAAETVRGGGLAWRAVVAFVAMLWISAAIAALLVPLLLDLWPVPEAAAGALRGALDAPHAPVAAAPPIADFFRSMVPSNPIAAAAQDQFLPLILFTTLFAVAVATLPRDTRERLTGFFDALARAMLVMVNWVLWLAPVGVFALALAVGLRAGGAAIGALAHYIVIVSGAGLAVALLAYPLARLGGGVALGRFARAVLPAQVVAVSTQSSLASLPAMLQSAERLGVRRAAAVTLPIAVAIFRVTGPAMNLAVAIYVAHWFGMELGIAQLAAGVAVAGLVSLGSVSLPGQVSFLTSITPIAAAMGVPVEPLALLIAVEMLPDIVRTLGNVSMDVAATTALARHAGPEEAGPETAGIGEQG